MTPEWYPLYLDGLLKYVDHFVAHGSRVEPLPFHSTSGYPYSPGEAVRRCLREYDSRTYTGSGNPSRLGSKDFAQRQP